MRPLFYAWNTLDVRFFIIVVENTVLIAPFITVFDITGFVWKAPFRVFCGLANFSSVSVILANKQRVVNVTVGDTSLRHVRISCATTVMMSVTCQRTVPSTFCAVFASPVIIARVIVLTRGIVSRRKFTSLRGISMRSSLTTEMTETTQTTMHLTPPL